MFLEPGYQKREDGLWVPEKSAGILPGMGGGLIKGLVLAVAKTGAGQDNASTPFTFPGISLGSIAANRKIIVGVNGVGVSAAVRSLTGISVAGNACTLVKPGAAQATTCAFGYVDDATNASGSVVVTWNSSMAGCGICVWALYGAATLYDTGQFTILGASSNTLAMSVNEVVGGISFFSAAGLDVGGSVLSFSSATLDQQTSANANIIGGFGTYKAPVTVSGRTETITWSNGETNRAGAAMHWR